MKRRNPIARQVHRAQSQWRKKLGMEHSLSELEPSLAAAELVFRAPPLSQELVDTLARIIPQFRLRVNSEASRRFWELNQNGQCWGEFIPIEPFLRSLEPAKVLDIGPGLGRSTVFFKKHLGWEDVPFHLYEGSGESTRYTRAGPRFSDSFCGDLDMLESILRFNGIENYEIFDARAMNGSLAGLPGPYDFICSFYAVGFHWSIGHFLDELLGLMTDKAVGVFTLHDTFEDFAELGDTPYRVVEFQGVWPRASWSRLLVMAKSEAALAAGG